MNFKAFAKLQSHPSLTAKMRTEPLRFETTIKGSCECHVGRISAHVGDISIRLAIPFLHPRRRLPLVATIGGFRVGLKPFDLRLTGMDLGIVGAISELACECEARVACESELQAEGKLPVKLGRIQVELDEDQTAE
jgi:hypothetical protein